MKAIVYDAYGPPEVLKPAEIPKPVPQADEVLIRIRATTITPGDCELRAFRFPALFWLPLRLAFGVFRPRMRVLGQELAGEIEAVGSNVTSFKPGEAVFGPAKVFGTYAEYVCLPASHAIARKPRELSFEEAAVLPTGGLNALYFLRKAKVRAGEKVLINGAAGNIGAFAVQLAKHFGAEVTGVDSSEKLEALKTIGADHVIDYTREDFTRNSEQYDVIFDVTNKTSFLRCAGSLKREGRFVIATPVLSDMLLGLLFSVTARKRVVTGVAPYRNEDLDYLKQLVEDGVLTPLIDRRYTFDTVVDGHRYVESGAKVGNVVLEVG